MTIERFSQPISEAGEPTWKKIDERKAVKQKINAHESELLKRKQRRRYAELNKEVKRITRVHKNVNNIR